jgi:DNA-binding NtrC family response regulator
MAHRMNKSSVLIVDDDPVMLEVLCEFLKRSLADVQVDATDSPNTALHHATSNHYSAVVTDVTMPGMSGLELASKILAMRPDTPIVFISGAAHALETCRSHAFACLRKPFDIETFLDTVRSALASYPFQARPIA